jgi:hypothetical protein
MLHKIANILLSLVLITQLSGCGIKGKLDYDDDQAYSYDK